MDTAEPIDADALEQLESDLLARAFLYSPPQIYRDAVQEVFAALRAIIAARAPRRARPA